jgi:hypothetical protein
MSLTALAECTGRRHLIDRGEAGGGGRRRLLTG